MSLLKRQGEMTTPNFIEEEFISALETLLNRSRFYQNKFVEISRISQMDENELGYDGVLTTIVPFYIQFKRSNFYSPHFEGKLATQRTSVKLPIDKGFFAFEIYKDDKIFKQHNLLYRLSETNKAAYVAPLFYKDSDLSRFKLQSKEYLPHYYDDLVVYDYHGVEHKFNNLRLFKNAITIPPHAAINDDNTSHHYSYCREYNIGFHSDVIYLNKSNSFYYFIRDIINQANQNKFIDTINSNFSLLSYFFTSDSDSQKFKSILITSINRNFMIPSDANIDSIIENLDVLDKLLLLEDILYNYFGIWQFIKFQR
jgi:hypothetical protein